jgi:hypothetical protein
LPVIKKKRKEKKQTNTLLLTRMFGYENKEYSANQTEREKTEQVIFFVVYIRAIPFFSLSIPMKQSRKCICNKFKRD